MSLECPQGVLNLAKKGQWNISVASPILKKKRDKSDLFILGELGDPVIFFALFSFNTSLKVLNIESIIK